MSDSAVVQAPYEERMQEYKALVDKFGVALIGAQTSGDIPCAHTIGARKMGLPDIYINGPMPHGKLMTILNRVFSRLQEGKFTMGQMPNVLGGGYNITLLPVTKEVAEFMCEQAPQAMMFYDKFPEYSTVEIAEGLPFVQILLPDENGNYPFSSEYMEELEQPVYCSQINH